MHWLPSRARKFQRTAGHSRSIQKLHPPTPNRNNESLPFQNAPPLPRHVRHPPIVDTVNVTNPPVPEHSPPESLDGKTELSGSDKEGVDPLNRTYNESVDSIELKFYEPPDTYESKHRWDPRAQWTIEEQESLRKRIDIRVAAFACLCFAALQLDRGNISNALSDTMLADLNMTTADYNTGMTIFYLCFLFAELPSQMISKKLGSDVWIPIQMMTWSAVAIAQMGLTGKSSFWATRALLGLLEGGFIADTVLFLSYWYTAAELTIRLSWFWVSYTVITILGAFLAAGLLEMRGIQGLSGWRWLFMIEGLLTFLVGFWAFWYLPASPTQTKKWWRPKGWFTEREEIIIINKVLRDDPTKSDMHNREGLSIKQLWYSLADYDMWPIYLIGLVAFIIPSTVQAYFTLTLKSLDFTTFQTNMLIIPSNVLFIIFNLALAFTSKKLKERLLTSSIQPIWHLVLLIALVTLSDDASRWVKWTILTLFMGYPYCHPIMVSMNSMNAGSVRTRTVSSSLYNMFVQAASLVASNIYQPSDAPYYHQGNKVLIGLSVASIALFVFAKLWYVWRNQQRAKVWDTWTVAEKAEYLATTSDKGNKRLDFRFQH